MFRQPVTRNSSEYLLFVSNTAEGRAGAPVPEGPSLRLFVISPRRALTLAVRSVLCYTHFHDERV